MSTHPLALDWSKLGLISGLKRLFSRQQLVEVLKLLAERMELDTPHGREIIGVLPRGFRFLSRDPDVYLPFRFDSDSVYLGNFSYQGIGRLRPDATVAEANAEATVSSTSRCVNCTGPGKSKP